MIKQFRTCENCNQNFIWDCEGTGETAGILDLREILDCSETRLIQWEKENPEIDLSAYFCWTCTSKIGDEIELEERENEVL